MNRPLAQPPLSRSQSANQIRSVHRMLAACALSNHHHQPAETIIKRAWPDDTSALLLTRAATSPATTAITAITPTRTGDVLLGLAPLSAAVRLFARSIQLDFTGVHTFLIPRPTMMPTPIFIGEGAPMPMPQVTFGGTTVGPTCKILIGSAVTNELENYAIESAAAILGRVLSAQATRSLDTFVFDNVATSATRPAGLLNGVTPLTATPAGTDSYAAMIEDLGKIGTAIATAGGNPDSIVLITAAEQAMTLRLLAGPSFQNPVFSTAALAAGKVIGIDASGIATGYSGLPVVETSKEATAHFEDTSPLPIATGAQGSGVLATPTRSAWQQDIQLIKVRANVAWASLYPGAVQTITSVNW
jgi:hypothetical protein